MRLLHLALLALVILIGTSAVCSAEHYSLAGWRCAGNDEGHGIAVMAVHVINEAGQPVQGVTIRFNGTLGTQSSITDYRGYAEYGFQFTGSPAVVSCTDPYGSTTDATPQLYNHDSHRVYEIVFMAKNNTSNPGLFDTSVCGNPLELSHAPRTNSFTFNTPLCTSYTSDTRALSANHVWEFGNTFVATADRAIAMRAHLTKGAFTRFRWTAQILEGGPDGPPMGPKKILPNEYIEGDNKYLLQYSVDECALKPGNTYYVRFATADGSEVNAYECLNDTYTGGVLYENQLPVAGKDLQAWVLGMNYGNGSVGTVSGTVRSSTGQPVSEAVVYFDREVNTGKNGTYKCYNVVPGTYNVSIAAPGYQTLTVPGVQVTAGNMLNTDFTLTPEAGPIQILNVTGASIEPGDQDVPVTMTVRNNGSGDVYVKSAGLSFHKGAVDVSSSFTVTPDGGNPAFIAGGATATFNFTVDVAQTAPSGSITVDGQLSGDVNLRQNGSFETDSYLPNYTGPSGWEWHSDEQPSVARLSYEHQVTYETTTVMPATTTKVRVRWIGKWSDTGSTNKKQGVRVYMPNGAGASWRTQLNVNCGTSYRNMSIGTNGTGDRTYAFTPGKYYQIDGTLNNNGQSQFIITPLEEQKTPGTINGTASANTGTTCTIKWGKMSDSGTEEMSCREFHLWYENNGTVTNEHHWVAVNGLLPTQDGYRMDSSGNQSMLPGAPWSSDTHFFINTSDMKDGAKSLDVWFSPSGSNKQLYLSSGSNTVQPKVPVQPGTTYTLSFWYKTINYIGDGYQLKLLWEEYDSAGTPYFQAGVDPPFHYNEPEPKTAGGWRQVVYKFTTTQWTYSCQFQVQLFKPSADPAAALLRIDDVRLTGPNAYADLAADTPGVFNVQGAIPVNNIAEAKSYPDGTTVSVSDVIVTGSPVGMEQTVFYIEESDRSSGIRVDKTNATGYTDVSEGDYVSLTGTLSTVDGERVLVTPNITSRTPGNAVKPVGMASKALGGAADGHTPGVEGGTGRNNVGLLVTAWGAVVSPGTQSFYIDDGSGLSDGIGNGVKVFCGNIPISNTATHACVTGFASIEEISGKYYRVIRPRKTTDIVWL